MEKYWEMHKGTFPQHTKLLNLHSQHVLQGKYDEIFELALKKFQPLLILSSWLRIFIFILVY